MAPEDPKWHVLDEMMKASQELFEAVKAQKDVTQNGERRGADPNGRGARGVGERSGRRGDGRGARRVCLTEW